MFILSSFCDSVFQFPMILKSCVIPEEVTVTKRDLVPSIVKNGEKVRTPAHLMATLYSVCFYWEPHVGTQCHFLFILKTDQDTKSAHATERQERKMSQQEKEAQQQTSTEDKLFSKAKSQSAVCQILWPPTKFLSTLMQYPDNYDLKMLSDRGRTLLVIFPSFTWYLASYKDGMKRLHRTR